MSQTPTIGRFVHYKLNSADAEKINKWRTDAGVSTDAGVELSSKGLGRQIHVGNTVYTGQTFPAIVVRQVNEMVNLQVLLDGNDTLWATSITEGDGERNWSWPPRT